MLTFESMYWSLQTLSFGTLCFRLILSVLLGGLAGGERERKQYAAGFRTYILVCLGATMTTVTSQYIILYLNLVADVMRLGAQVISGIGFLCAGTVLISERKNVRGLTTAAGLWCTAIVGLSIGIGYYEAAILCVALQLLVMWLLQKLEKHAFSNNVVIDFHLEIKDVHQTEDVLEEIRAMGYIIRNISLKAPVCNIENAIGLEMTLAVDKKRERSTLIKQLLGLNGVIVAIDIT